MPEQTNICLDCDWRWVDDGPSSRCPNCDGKDLQVMDEEETVLNEADELLLHIMGQPFKPGQLEEIMQDANDERDEVIAKIALILRMTKDDPEHEVVGAILGIIASEVGKASKSVAAIFQGIIEGERNNADALASSLILATTNPEWPDAVPHKVLISVIVQHMQHVGDRVNVDDGISTFIKAMEVIQ